MFQNQLYRANVFQTEQNQKTPNMTAFLHTISEINTNINIVLVFSNTTFCTPSGICHGHKLMTASHERPHDTIYCH